MREEEEEMDLIDYMRYQNSKGVSDEEALEKWRALLATDIDRSGEGKDTKIWISRNRKRLRDAVYYKDAGVEDSQKPVKNMTAADRPAWCLECCIDADVQSLSHI